MASSSTGSRVKWISDLDKNVLSTNFEKRGWVKGSSEGMVHLAGFHLGIWSWGGGSVHVVYTDSLIIINSSTGKN